MISFDTSSQTMWEPLPVPLTTRPGAAAADGGRAGWLRPAAARPPAHGAHQTRWLAAADRRSSLGAAGAGRREPCLPETQSWQLAWRLAGGPCPERPDIMLEPVTRARRWDDGALDHTEPNMGREGSTVTIGAVLPPSTSDWIWSART